MGTTYLEFSIIPRCIPPAELPFEIIEEPFAQRLLLHHLCQEVDVSHCHFRYGVQWNENGNVIFEKSPPVYVYLVEVIRSLFHSS